MKIYSVYYNEIIYSKMPDRNSDHLTPATKLLEKRRETAEVEQALTTQKEASTILLYVYSWVAIC